MKNIDKRKFLSLKYDFIFKECIGKPGKEKRLVSLFETITQIKLNNLKVKGAVELRKYYNIDKGGIIDVQAQNDTNIVHIEMQQTRVKGLCVRLMYYWGKQFIGQAKKGGKYKDLKKVITLWILDYNLDDDIKCIEKYQIMNDKKKNQIMDCLEIYIVELPKIKNFKQDYTNLQYLWLKLLSTETEEELLALQGYNEIIDEVIEEVRRLNQSEEMRTLELYQELARMDRQQMMDDCREEGLMKGIREGRKKGMKEGMKEGMKQGKEENTITTIVSMFRCKIDIQIIAKVFNMKKLEVIEILKKQKCI